MLGLKQVLVTGNQHVNRTVQGSGDNPLIVRVALGPCRWSGGRNYFCIFINECCYLFNLMHRHPELALKHSFEFSENRLANEKLVFSEYELEYVLANTPSSEGSYQDIGIQQDPHGCCRDRRLFTCFRKNRL